MAFYKPNAILNINGQTLEVCIKRKSDPRTTDNQGLANVRLFYVGNLVNPKVLPDSVNVGDKGTINIDSGTLQGDFLLFDIHRTRFKSLESTLGQTFSGYLMPSKKYDESEWT
jgi:hypothetical protein